MAGLQRVSIIRLSSCIHGNGEHDRHKLGLVIILFSTCLIGLSLQEQPPDPQVPSAHIMMDVGNDTRPIAASSHPEGSGSFDKKGVIKRDRRDTVPVYDWPLLVAKHNALRKLEKASNMEMLVSLKRRVLLN